MASDGAVTGRLRYLGIPGLQAALTVQHQFDPSQAADDGLVTEEEAVWYADEDLETFQLVAIDIPKNFAPNTGPE